MNQPNQAKRAVRELERRLAEMPPNVAGQRLLLALKMVPGQEHIFESCPVLRRELAKDAAAFIASKGA